MSEVQSTDKKQALLAQLKQSIADVQDSQRFKDYLAFSASFHGYSVSNLMLIWLQRPDATRVAGFHAWLKLHRYVKKGEKGIAILAPCVGRKKSDDENDDEPQTVHFFKTVYVFDVSQTDGEDLPDLCDRLEGDAPELWTRLSSLAAKQGIDLDISDDEEGVPAGANGYYQASKQRIWIRNASQAQMAKTLAHELAHYFAHEDCKGASYAEGEIVADSAAYVVASMHGLDTGTFSFEYVATWASRAEKGAFEKQLGTIHKVADAILAGVS